MSSIRIALALALFFVVYVKAQGSWESVNREDKETSKKPKPTKDGEPEEDATTAGTGFDDWRMHKYKH